MSEEISITGSMPPSPKALNFKAKGELSRNDWNHGHAGVPKNPKSSANTDNSTRGTVITAGLSCGAPEP